MSKAFEATYQNNYSGDGVINRGYDIYDEWKAKGLSSRKIVASAEGAANATKQNNTVSKSMEALAYLFALDLRISERYGSLLRCVLSYFSYIRETRALKRIKEILHIASYSDIRSAIEVELQLLRERLDEETSEEGDDETHGGRRNGKAEEEAVAEEKAAQEQSAEETAEEVAETEEAEATAEEKAEEASETAPTDEAKIESDEPMQETEPVQEETAAEQVVQKENREIKEENNGSVEISEPSTDKKEEAKTYNSAEDIIPISEETVSERKSEKTSFIDEMIIDDMVKGDKSIIGYRRIDEAERIRDAAIPQDTTASQSEENKGAHKDAYLYDKTDAIYKGEAQQTVNTETVQESKKTEVKEQKETVSNDSKAQTDEKETKSLSEMLQADLNENNKNTVANALNDTMSLESKMAYLRMQEDMLREQISISNKELGIDDHVDVIKISETEQTNQPSMGVNRK